MKVLFFGGWAVPRSVLSQIWAAALPTIWDVNWIPLDGSADHGRVPDEVSVDLVAGWSVGGQYAVRLAMARDLPVLTLGSGPRFATPEHSARQTWLNGFQRDFEQFPQRTLRRFCLMMAHGGDHSRSALRGLQAALTTGLADRYPRLQDELRALSGQDFTRLWAETRARRLSIVFDADAVFPCTGRDDSTFELPGGHLPDAAQCHNILERLETRYGH